MAFCVRFVEINQQTPALFFILPSDLFTKYALCTKPQIYIVLRVIYECEKCFDNQFNNTSPKIKINYFKICKTKGMKNKLSEFRIMCNNDYFIT